MTSRTTIAELRRLEGEAHPGPWMRAYHKVVFTHPEHLKGLRTEVRGTSFTGVECHAITRQVDGELIAAARNALPQLLDDAERLSAWEQWAREHGYFALFALTAAKELSATTEQRVELDRSRVALSQLLSTVPK